MSVGIPVAGDAFDNVALLLVAQCPVPPPPCILREIREVLLLSQGEFAVAIGLSPRHGAKVVRRWEHAPDHAPLPTAWAAIRFLLLLWFVKAEGERQAANEPVMRVLLAPYIPEGIS